MATSFLFMDESYCAATKFSSLTGLIIPVPQYAALRDAFYEALHKCIPSEPNVIRLAPELHGRDFLRTYSDEVKLAVLQAMTALLVRHEAQVIRVGYFITSVTESVFVGDKKLMGLCWTSLLSMLEPVLATSTLIPVMDGFDPHTVRALSAPVRFLDNYRAQRNEGNLSIRHSGNLLGEVFYADSQHSVLIQLADMVAYLRNAVDRKLFGAPITQFKEQLIAIAAALEPILVREERVTLLMDGEPQGPRQFVHPIYRSNGPLTRVVSVTPSDTEPIKMLPDKL